MDTASRFNRVVKTVKPVAKERVMHDNQMVIAAKAIYDALTDTIPEHVTKALEPHLKDMEHGATMLIGKVLRKELDGEISKITKDFDDKLTLLQISYNKSLEEMRYTYEMGLKQIETIIKCIPLPHVHIPENSIQITVEQLPSQVILPERSIHVDIPATIFQPQINIPEGPAPLVTINNPEMKPIFQVPEQTSIVNITVPELKVPGVTVNLPEAAPPVVNVDIPKRSVIKSIIYDEYNRPAQITEREEDA